MEKEMQSAVPDQPTKSDRSLRITCTPTLVWKNSSPPYQIDGTMTYNQTGSSPHMPGVVNRTTGDINLRHMPSDGKYTDNIDIFLTLDPSLLTDPHGNSIAGAWAEPGDGPDPGMGAAWFIAVPPPLDYTPIPVPAGMAIKRESNTLVVIDDDTPIGSPKYAFCTAIALPGYAGAFIIFEPMISDKGKGAPLEFMMKS